VHGVWYLSTKATDRLHRSDFGKLLVEKSDFGKNRRESTADLWLNRQIRNVLQHHQATTESFYRHCYAVKES